MAQNWNEERTKARAATRFAEVKDVEIVRYVRDTSLSNIPVKRAYRMDAAHLYVDIVNLDGILGTTASEGTRSHQRALKFLNLHYRAVHRIIEATDSIRVDFHNERLHAVVPKPYGDANSAQRVKRAVAISQLIIEVLAETGDETIPAATVRVGIDSGQALAVSNGRRAAREPLFLGRPANLAAKCAGAGDEPGIYLGNAARKAIGLDELDDDEERTTALTADEIKICVDEAGLEISKDEVIKLWKEEMADSPIGDFVFSRPTPPLENLDISALSASNSRRFEGVSMFGDIDGFSNYVDEHIDEKPEQLVQALHVLRSELDAIINADFKGRRLRFVGDCVHGLLLEGTARETDIQKTLSIATQCAGAMRSGFAVTLDYLKGKKLDVENLGLAIGFDYGPISVTRLGMKGKKTRCAVGRAVLESEQQQLPCDGDETALGQSAYNASSSAIRNLFGASRKAKGLTYDYVVGALAGSGDKSAKEVRESALVAAIPAAAPLLATPYRPYSDG